MNDKYSLKSSSPGKFWHDQELSDSKILMCLLNKALIFKEGPLYDAVNYMFLVYLVLLGSNSPTFHKHDVHEERETVRSFPVVETYPGETQFIREVKVNVTCPCPVLPSIHHYLNVISIIQAQ